MTEIVIPYAPRLLQARLHESLKRFNVLVAHRRFGKTVFCINELIKKALECKLKDGRYGYLAPQLGQAKDIAWMYLKRYALVIPGATANEAELRVDFPNGARIRLYGAENPERMRGGYFDGIVLDEYAQIAPRVFPEIIRPMLADRQGWAIFIGTPMGENQFAEIYRLAQQDDVWFAALFKASETGVVPQVELDAARRMMTDDQYAREFECSFAASVPGAYYAKLLERAEQGGRISRVAWEPRLPVVTAWDLGIDDMTAIWFIQEHFNEIRVIDYYECAGMPLSHYASVLGSKDFVYGRHLLPHDVEVRELGTGQSRLETLRGLGIKAQVVHRQEIMDGIEAVRNVLPRCWFDAQACEKGLKALRQYRADWDERTNQPRPRPLHDWTSHAADAFRYYALGSRQTKPDSIARQRTRFAEGSDGSGWGFNA